VFSRIPAPVQTGLAIAIPVISLLLAYFLAVPRYRALQADRQELQRTEELVKVKKRAIEEAKAAQRTTEVIALQPATLDEPVTFMRDLIAVARSNNVRLVNYRSTTADALPGTPAPGAAPVPPTPGQPAPPAADPATQMPPGTTPVALQISAEGTYASMARFFESLERYRRLISVSNVSMTSTKFPTLTAQFRLTRYRRPADPPPAATPSPSG
jgi:hypothetical protein